MPLQRVVERNALTDEALAMVHEQPQIEFRALQLRGRQVVQAFAQRRSRDRNRVDAVGLPARAGAAPRVGHQRRRDAQDALAASDQNRSKEPETCRQSSSAHTRSLPSSRAQTTSAAKPLAPTWTVCSPSSSPVADATAAIVCERL